MSAPERSPELVEPRPIPVGIEVVRRTTFPPAPLTPGQAALELRLLDASFRLFTNVDTGEENVVYRRRDGRYGLVEPQSSR